MPNLSQKSVSATPQSQVSWESWEQRERVYAHCRDNGWSLSWFIRTAVEKEIKRTTGLTEKDYRQALDNLVEDPNCDYRLVMRNDQGRILIENKHTQVGLWFDDDAQAADHILGEEPQQPAL